MQLWQQLTMSDLGFHFHSDSMHCTLNLEMNKSSCDVLDSCSDLLPEPNTNLHQDMGWFDFRCPYHRHASVSSDLNPAVHMPVQLPNLPLHMNSHTVVMFPAQFSLETAHSTNTQTTQMQLRRRVSLCSNFAVKKMFFFTHCLVTGNT